MISSLGIELTRTIKPPTFDLETFSAHRMVFSTASFFSPHVFGLFFFDLRWSSAFDRRDGSQFLSFSPKALRDQTVPRNPLAF